MVFYHSDPVVLDGSTSTANCGSIDQYRWQIDDVTVSWSSVYSHTFNLVSGESERVFKVQLRVRNTAGKYGYKTIYVTVTRNNKSLYYLTDHLGSVRVTVNEQGDPVGWDDYYPFGLQMPGRTQNASNPNDDQKFTGYLLEQQGDLGIYHAEARMYDPVVGRFMQTDPLADDPTQLDKSPYAYTWNNPVNLTDPDGKCVPWCVGALIGAAVELGSQITTNMTNGASFTQALGNVDVFDVGVAAGAGALSGGLSTIKSIGTITKTGIAVATNVTEGVTKANLGDQIQEHGMSDVAKDAVLGLFGSVAGDFGSKITAKTNTAQSLQKKSATLDRRAGNKAGHLTTTKGAAAAKAQRKADNFAARRGVFAGAATQAAGKGVLQVGRSNNTQANQPFMILNTGSRGIVPIDKTRVVIPFRREY